MTQKMIEIAIVEDEQLAAKELSKMLQKLRPNTISIKVILTNVNDAIDFFKHNQVDLIFMDIHLGDGKSFNIFKELDLQTPIIYTTAYDQYALQAFKQYSVDYLLKPIDEDDLEGALLKYEKIFNKKSNEVYQQINQNLESLLNHVQYQKRFMVNSGDRILSLQVEQIAYFMADGKSLLLFTTDGHRYIFDSTLSAIETRLSPKVFFKINRKFIVNYQAIADMHHYSKSRIKLSLQPEPEQGLDVIVSQDRSAEFKQWLNQ